MYQLKSDQIENRRRVKTFVNQTGTETKITTIYKDAEGVQWWGFIDLFKIPYIRTVYAKHVTDLFTIGLSLKDILEWCNQEKQLLRSEDPEKYEKLYSLILEKEKLASHTADPIKQHLALASVYILKDDESVDTFNDSLAEEKMRLWSADQKATAFFLSWLTEVTQHYMKDFKKSSQILSKLMP